MNAVVELRATGPRDPVEVVLSRENRDDRVFQTCIPGGLMLAGERVELARVIAEVYREGLEDGRDEERCERIRGRL